MKTLKFKHNLVAKIMGGEKTVTWRLFDDKDLRAGDMLDFIDRDSGEKFAQAEVLGVEEKTMSDLTELDLRCNDYKDKNQVLVNNRDLYGNKVSWDTIVKIVKFKLL